MRIYLIILLYTFPLAGFGQHSSVLGYDNKVYNAARQNWSVKADDSGIVYFANHNGLLVFDGIRWKKYELPAKTILRSVYVLNDSVLLSSGFMELGYWKKNQFGQLVYHSLNDKASAFFTPNIEFWNIEEAGNTYYFQSFFSIIAFQSDSVYKISLPGFASSMKKINDKLLVSVDNMGLYEIVKGKLTPFLVDPIFKGKSIRFMIPYNQTQLVIGTASHGLFLWDGKSIQPWKKEWIGYFSANELNRGSVTQNGAMVFGTIIDGVLIFDRNGNFVRKVNAGNGLPNNTVLGIDSDKWGNIWLGLDNGIGYISQNIDKSYVLNEIKNAGAVYSMVYYNNQLYLGTNQGLFAKNNGGSAYSVIQGTQGQVWDCRIIDEKLWISHNSGTLILDKNGIQHISNWSGGFSLRADPVNSNFLLQCTYFGLVVYEKQGNNWKFRNHINNFTELIRYIEIDHHGNIWASHMHKGIYRIKTDKNRNNATDIRYFGTETFGKDFSIQVFKVLNRIVFTTGSKIYTYDDLNDKIIPYDFLNTRLGIFAASNRIIETPGNKFWFICKEGIALFLVTEKEVVMEKMYPTNLFSDFLLVEEFENLLPVSDNHAILCLQNGYAELNTEYGNIASHIEKLVPVLQSIELEDNSKTKIFLPTRAKFPKIDYKNRNIRFVFSFPKFSELALFFRYKLDGLSADWSEKLKNPEFNFERLSPGEYNLKVKAIDLYGNESIQFEYPFTIKPPFYQSFAAILLYFVLIMVSMLGFRAWGIRQTRKKELLKQQTRERELVQLRYEKLNIEIEHKSKELANSTMSIIKKNEFLMDLKNSIARQKEELGSRYPDKYYNHLLNKIDNNISDHDDWKIFETHFERAHEQFIEKIKSRFPDLTPGDLRLCAYLRLNLSSKEIAPLLGISVRAVENHRYRLRKKMKIDHENALSDVIHAV